MKKIVLFMLSLVLVRSVSAQDSYLTTSHTDAGRITTDKAVSRLSFPQDFKLFNLDASWVVAKLLTIVGK